jgi:hypothetical protein
MMFNNDFLNKRKLSLRHALLNVEPIHSHHSKLVIAMMVQWQLIYLDGQKIVLRDDAGYFRVRTNSKNKLSVPELGTVVNMTSLQPSDSGEEN